MTTGILALQGCVEPHVRMLERLKEKCVPVRSASELAVVDRLILPGGESTTMLLLMNKLGLTEELIRFGRTKPMWGVCAGAILLARQVINPAQYSLGLINIRASRNYYGSQRESFKREIEIEALGMKTEVDFIRAPLLEPLAATVKVHARDGEQAVFLEERNIIATSFHIELGQETRLHEYFLSKAS